MVIIEGNAWRGVYLSKRGTLSGAFLFHLVRNDLVSGFRSVMFRVDSNHVTGLRDIPHTFIPMVFFHVVTRMLLQQTVNGIVCMNGGKRLRRANAVNDDVLSLASGRSLRSMDVEMALMHNRIPVDGINVLDHFPFVVVNDDVILEGFFDLGQEVCVDDGNFLGSFRIFRLEFKTEHDLLHFFINVGGRGAGFGSGGRDGIISVGKGGAISLAS
jgi:hypothetical protein